MNSRSPSQQEQSIRAFALNVRLAAGMVVNPPVHIRDLAALDPARYGLSLGAWAEGMRAGTMPAPAPNRANVADTTYYLCTNCFEARDRLHQTETAEVQPLVDHHCLTCGTQKHALIRIAGSRKKDAPKLYPVQKISMAGPVQVVRPAAPGPPGSGRLASALSSVRPGSVAARAFVGDFWDHPLTGSEHRFRQMFGDETTANSARRPMVDHDGERYAPVVRIGDSDIPLLRAHQYFASYLKGGGAVRASSVDSGGRVLLNERLGNGSFGLVVSVSPKGRATDHAMKVMIALQPTHTTIKNGAQYLHIDKAGVPLYEEYVTGMGLRVISESLPPGTPPLNVMAPECIFGLLIPGGWEDTDEGVTTRSKVAVAICIVMPKMAMDSSTAIKRLPIQSQRIIFVRNLLRSVAATLAPLHDSGFIHADVKTENILIPQNVDPAFLPEAAIDAVICDYSLSRYGPADYICMSCDYRAPEVWLELEWTSAIDIWGLGCVAIEAYTGGTFFVDEPQKCNHPPEFITRIAEYFGPFPEHMVAASPRSAAIRKILRDAGRRNPAHLLRPGPSHRAPISTDLPHEEALLRLLGRMLVVDPANRCTAADILTDPFLTDQPIKWQAPP
jgi:serine/threonine protein kinase